MNRLALQTTAIVFVLVSVAQAVPLVFHVAEDSSFLPPDFPEPLAIDVSVNPNIHKMEVSTQPGGHGRYNFKVDLGAVDLGEFVDIDGLGVETEVAEYRDNGVSFDIKSELPGTISIGNVRKKDSNSFDVLFDVSQSGVGTSAYRIHWQANQFESILFTRYDARVSPSNPHRVLVSFDLRGPPDRETPAGSLLFTATISGDFSPVPEPATALLLGCALVGLSAFRRRFSVLTCKICARRAHV